MVGVPCCEKCTTDVCEECVLWVIRKMLLRTHGTRILLQAGLHPSVLLNLPSPNVCLLFSIRKCGLSNQSFYKPDHGHRGRNKWTKCHMAPHYKNSMGDMHLSISSNFFSGSERIFGDRTVFSRFFSGRPNEALNLLTLSSAASLRSMGKLSYLSFGVRIVH
jgi:hypothetical protein